MRGCLLFIFVFPLLAAAQKFSAADLRQLKAYSTGVFSNEVKAAADSYFIPSVIKVQPLWQKRKDGIWLFTEKTDTGHLYEVWHFYLQDDTTLVMQLLDFKEQQKALQLSQDGKQEAGLNLYHLFARRGCELYLTKNKTGYTGTSTGRDCMAEKPGVEYAVYNFTVTKNSILWQETNFAKEDKQLTAATWHFIKQVKASK